MTEESLIRVKLLDLLQKAETTDESSELVLIQKILNDVFDLIKKEENWGVLSLEHKTYAKTIEGMLRALTQQPLEISLDTLFRVMGETIRTTIKPVPPLIQLHPNELLIPTKTLLEIKKTYEKKSEEDFKEKAIEAILTRKTAKEEINTQEFKNILENAREILKKGVKIKELTKNRELLDAVSTLSGHLDKTEKIIMKKDSLYLVSARKKASMKKKTLIVDNVDAEK